MRCWQAVLAAMVLRCRKHRPGGSGRVLQQPCVARAIADRLTSRTAGSLQHWLAAAKIGSNAAVFATNGSSSDSQCFFWCPAETRTNLKRRRLKSPSVVVVKLPRRSPVTMAPNRRRWSGPANTGPASAVSVPPYAAPRASDDPTTRRTPRPCSIVQQIRGRLQNTRRHARENTKAKRAANFIEGAEAPQNP